MVTRWYRAPELILTREYDEARLLPLARPTLDHAVCLILRLTHLGVVTLFAVGAYYTVRVVPGF